MADHRPSWDEVFERAFVVALGRHNAKVTVDDLIRTVNAVAPLHGIPVGYNRRTQEYRIERAEKWLKEKSHKVKRFEHTHLEAAFVVEHGPLNHYDTAFGSWHLVHSHSGGLAWQRIDAPNGRVALQCVTNNEEALIRALLSFAIQTNCAVTVPIPVMPYRGSYPPPEDNPKRLILTSTSESRFRKGGDVRYVQGLPPGVALLFLHNPEHTGLLLIDDSDHGRRQYGMTAIPGSVYALQITQPGFEPLERTVHVRTE